jgi:hypothetical protein
VSECCEKEKRISRLRNFNCFYGSFDVLLVAHSKVLKRFSTCLQAVLEADREQEGFWIRSGIVVFPKNSYIKDNTVI